LLVAEFRHRSEERRDETELFECRADKELPCDGDHRETANYTPIPLDPIA